MTAVAEVEAARPETESKINLVYMPGLDGLRGLWLFPVLFGHAGFVALLPGAWLSVSGFFTLSGFLITSLMLLEHKRTGRIALGRFWVRRFRRLLPAALVTIFLIIVASSIHPFWPQAGLRGDLTSTLFYVVNWRFIAQGHSYATAFTSGPSPVDHFWSLSVEEQYYLIFPLLMIGLFALRKRWARSTALVLLGVWIASGIRAASWYSGGDWSRAYYATDSRLGEMMMGALLALLLANRRVDHWISGRVGKRLAAAAGIACFVGWILLCLSLSLSNPLTYHGGLMFVSFLSAGSIMAVTIDTPLRRLASHRTLCWLGTRVYPIYLLHFPIFIILSPGRLHAYLPWPHSYQDLRWATLVLGSALAIALAGLSQRYLESPIRSGTRLPGRQFTFAAIGSVLVLLTLIAYTPFRGTDDGNINLRNIVRSAQREQVQQRKQWDASSNRVLVVGDSLAWVLSTGLREWGAGHSFSSLSAPNPGCGTAREGTADYLGLQGSVAAACPSLSGVITSKVTSLHPTTLVILASGRDLADITMPDGSTEHIGEPAFNRRLLADLSKVVTVAASKGIPVVWLLEPHMRANAYTDSSWRQFPENDPTRMDQLNSLIGRAVAGAPAGSSVRTIDLGAFRAAPSRRRVRPGLPARRRALLAAGSLEVARWLGPQLECTPARTPGTATSQTTSSVATTCAAPPTTPTTTTHR